MKVIYIAGKYRGRTPWEVEQNIRTTKKITTRVWAKGMVALCPHANSRHMEGVATDEVFLAGTMELLRRSDAVLLVPNWRDSAGARAEVEEADRPCPDSGGHHALSEASNLFSCPATPSPRST